MRTMLSTFIILTLGNRRIPWYLIRHSVNLSWSQDLLVLSVDIFLSAAPSQWETDQLSCILLFAIPQCVIVIQTRKNTETSCFKQKAQKQTAKRWKIFKTPRNVIYLHVSFSTFSFSFSNSLFCSKLLSHPKFSTFAFLGEQNYCSF